MAPLPTSRTISNSPLVALVSRAKTASQTEEREPGPDAARISPQPEQNWAPGSIRSPQLGHRLRDSPEATIVLVGALDSGLRTDPQPEQNMAPGAAGRPQEAQERVSSDISQ